MSSRRRSGRGFPARVALVLTARCLTARCLTARCLTARCLTALGSALALLAGLCRVTGYLLLAPSGSPALAVTVLAGAVLAGLVASCLALAAGLARTSAAVPLISRSAALREKSWRAGFGRQRDPDAAGRPRPRAPSAAPAAVAS